MNAFGVAAVLVASGLAIPFSAAGQTAAEYGAITGKSGTTAAGASRLGKSAKSVFSSAQETLEKAANPGAKETAQPDAAGASRSRADTRLQSKVKFGTACIEKNESIEEGMDYDAVLKLCGTPAMTTSLGGGDTSLLYTAEGADLTVIVTNGKVTEFRRTRRPVSPAVVVLK